jgi:hypothetical protein
MFIIGFYRWSLIAPIDFSAFDRGFLPDRELLAS